MTAPVGKTFLGTRFCADALFAPMPAPSLKGKQVSFEEMTQREFRTPVARAPLRTRFASSNWSLLRSTPL